MAKSPEGRELTRLFFVPIQVSRARERQRVGCLPGQWVGAPRRKGGDGASASSGDMGRFPCVEGRSRHSIVGFALFSSSAFGLQVLGQERQSICSRKDILQSFLSLEDTEEFSPIIPFYRPKNQYPRR